MSYVAPPEVTEDMLAQGTSKSELSSWQQLLRGTISGFVLSGATVMAILAAEEAGNSLVGALVFPMGLAVVVVLGLELLTGNFALVPLAVLDGRARLASLARSFGVVLAGHVIGGLLCALLFAAWLTELWTGGSGLLIDGLIDMAEDKTLAYQDLGMSAGLSLALLSGILCNWLVVLGVVMGMTSTSTTGKLAALWLPIAAFFYLELEHAVVNLFVIPAGMMVGADVGVVDWLVWNQVPVLIGNLIGGFFLLGLPVYLAFRTKQEDLPADAAEEPSEGL